MMDSSEGLTPPGSPILGYSGLRKLPADPVNLFRDYFMHAEFTADVPDVPVHGFFCKGPILPRSSDNSFSSNGIFARKQVISALKILKKDFHYTDDDEFALSHIMDSEPDPAPIQSGMHSLLGHNFAPFENPEDFTVIMKMVQKKVFTLMNLSRPNIIIGAKRNSGDNVRTPVSDPFKIRRDVLKVFNLLVTHRDNLVDQQQQLSDQDHLVALSDEKIRQYFSGLKKCLGTVSSLWSPTLKFHCGSKEGNECTSPDFHLFHLHLELRWCLLVISGLNPNISNWIIQDLLELALLKYQSNSHSTLEAVPPFNCYCVKELWSMIRALIDEINPPGNQFWDLVIANLSVKCSTMESNLHYPLWFLSHLVSVYDYGLNGIYLPKVGIQGGATTVNSSCCYKFVNQLVKRWIQCKGKIEDVVQFIRRFIPYWGFDLEMFNTLWSDLLPKLDKGVEVGSMRHYSSSVKWYKLISQQIAKNDKEIPTASERESTEPFIEFLNLLYMQVKLCSLKDYRKLKSSLCNRLTPKIVGSLNEIGLARVSTMYLVLAFGTEDSLALCERLNETLNQSKDLFAQTKLRARCTMILLLLTKSVNISTICLELMKSIDEFIITSSRNLIEKDLVMIYIETIEYLTICGSDMNLGQSELIPSNLTVWLTSCGQNCVVRTLNSLHKLFENWILKDSSSMNNISNNEKNKIGEMIKERTLPFIKQSVTVSQQQKFASDYDVKPFADMAADFTISHGLLQHLYMNADTVAKLFEYFAVNDKVCPNVSERYVSQLIRSKWSWSGIISDVLLLQAWIRLVFFGYDVPLQLSSHVLSLNNKIAFPSITTKTELLLNQFCQIVNESASDYWNRNQLQTLLSPTLATLKTIGTISGSGASSSSSIQAENASRTESYIKSCSTLLRTIQFDKIYVRNSQSFVHQVLDTFCPPFVGKMPWEKFPQSVIVPLRKYLPEFFISVVSYDHWKQDAYLKRKLGDVIRFALLGYTNVDELSDSNPGLIIMQYCEKQPNSPELLAEVTASFQNVSKDTKLTKKYLLTTLGFLKRHMIPTVIALIYSIMEILLEREAEYITVCTNILSHISATVMTGRIPNCEALKSNLMQTLDAMMSKHFAFRSKKFFDLFNNLTGGSSSSSSNVNAKALPLVRKFVKLDVIPLVQNYVHVSEAKQGSGTNFTLRRQLEELEKRLTDTGPGF